jgi:hypothetical protein
MRSLTALIANSTGLKFLWTDQVSLQFDGVQNECPGTALHCERAAAIDCLCWPWMLLFSLTPCRLLSQVIVHDGATISSINVNRQVFSDALFVRVGDGTSRLLVLSGSQDITLSNSVRLRFWCAQRVCRVGSLTLLL